MPLRYEARWYTPAMCRAEPSALFAFGDNARRAGSGPKSGQAIIRSEPNAVGIVVKHAPSRELSAYLSNADLELFQRLNGPAFASLAAHLRAGRVVVWPADGIGTGRAELPERAPCLWASLERARLRIEAITAPSDTRTPSTGCDSYQS